MMDVSRNNFGLKVFNHRQKIILVPSISMIGSDKIVDNMFANGSNSYNMFRSNLHNFLVY